MDIDLSTADVAESHISFKTKKVAERKALEWANLNPNPDDVEVTLGEPFRSSYWNGGYDVEVWLAYDISTTDEGWTVTSYRWHTNPTPSAREQA